MMRRMVQQRDGEERRAGLIDGARSYDRRGSLFVLVLRLLLPVEDQILLFKIVEF